MISLAFRRSFLFRFAQFAESISTCFATRQEVTLWRWAQFVLCFVAFGALVDLRRSIGHTHEHAHGAHSASHYQDVHPPDQLVHHHHHEHGHHPLVLPSLDNEPEVGPDQAPLERRPARWSMPGELKLLPPVSVSIPSKRQLELMMDQATFFGVRAPVPLLFAAGSATPGQAAHQVPARGALLNFYEFLLRGRCHQRADAPPNDDNLVVQVDLGILGQESVLAAQLGCPLLVFDPLARYRDHFWASMAINRLPHADHPSQIRWVSALPADTRTDETLRSRVVFAALQKSFELRLLANASRHTDDGAAKWPARDLDQVEKAAAAAAKPSAAGLFDIGADETVVWVPSEGRHCTDCCVLLSSLLGTANNTAELARRAAQAAQVLGPRLLSQGRFVRAALATPDPNGSADFLPPALFNPKSTASIVLLHVSVGAFGGRSVNSLRSVLAQRTNNVLVTWPLDDGRRLAKDTDELKQLAETLMNASDSKNPLHVWVAASDHVTRQGPSAPWPSWPELAATLGFHPIQPKQDIQSLLTTVTKFREQQQSLASGSSLSAEPTLLLFFSRDPRVL